MGISVAFMFLLLVLLFLAGAVGMVVLLVARARKPKVDQASCGNCLYAVEGLTTMTCPECGSDLRKVGIVTPGRSPGAGPQLWIILWTLLLPLPALLISRMVVVAWPATFTSQRFVTLRPSDARAFDRVEIELWSRGADQPGQFDWATLELLANGNPLGDPLRLQLGTLRWDVGGDDSSSDLSAQAVTSSDVARWIADASEAESEQPYVPTAVALLRIVQQGTAGPSVSVSGEFNSVNLNTVQSATKPTWLTPVLWLVWLVTWGAGVLMILRRARAHSNDEPEAKTRIIDVSAE